MVWPIARTKWELLDGAKVKFDERTAVLLQSLNRRKRDVSSAFGAATSSVLPRRTFEPKVKCHEQQNVPDSDWAGSGTRIMAQMLGLHIPGTNALSAGFPEPNRMPDLSLPVSQLMAVTRVASMPPPLGSLPSSQQALLQGRPGPPRRTSSGRITSVFESFDFERFTNSDDDFDYSSFLNNVEGSILPSFTDPSSYNSKTS